MAVQRTPLSALVQFVGQRLLGGGGDGGAGQPGRGANPQ